MISNQIKCDVYNLICFWTSIVNEDSAKLSLQKMCMTEGDHFEEPTFYFSGQKSRRMGKNDNFKWKQEAEMDPESRKTSIIMMKLVLCMMEAKAYDSCSSQVIFLSITFK